MAAAQAASQRQLWIFDAPRDLGLIVLTPLLLLPLGLGARQFFSAEAIFLAVMTFGNMGHHLPGMIRAYGDRRLFDRFRMRFVVGPALLLAICFYLAIYDLAALIFMLSLWGLWHGLAQVYGFCRIYDAKVGMSSRTGALLDRGMCLSWFVGGVLFSDPRMIVFLDLFWQSGGPPVLAAHVQWVRDVFALVIAGASVSWLGFVLWQWRSGRPPSVVKVALLVSSCAFWWFCVVMVDEVLLGLAMFEVVHDTQYLAIVWLYNRKRVSQGGELLGAVRYLFQGRRLLIPLYVALVFAYGSLGLLGRNLAESGILPVTMNALIAFSAFLHFYYDSFIWSVSDRETRKTLALDPGAETLRWRAPSWLGHAGRWAYFVLPIVALLALSGRPGSELWRWTEAARAFPNSPRAHAVLGEQLITHGDPEGAVDVFAEALVLRPDYPRARAGQGYAALKLRQSQPALEAFEEALAFDDEYVPAWVGVATVALERGDLARAREAADRARSLERRDANAILIDAKVSHREGELERAESILREAEGLNPPRAVVFCELGLVLADQGRIEEARNAYARARALGSCDERTERGARRVEQRVSTGF